MIYITLLLKLVIPQKEHSMRIQFRILHVGSVSNWSHKEVNASVTILSWTFHQLA